MVRARRIHASLCRFCRYVLRCIGSSWRFPERNRSRHYYDNESQPPETHATNVSAPRVMPSKSADQSGANPRPGSLTGGCGHTPQSFGQTGFRAIVGLQTGLRIGLWIYFMHF
jgi:hypothetical protein